MIKMPLCILLLVAPAVLAVKIRNQQPLGLLQNARILESNPHRSRSSKGKKSSKGSKRGHSKSRHGKSRHSKSGKSSRSRSSDSKSRSSDSDSIDEQGECNLNQDHELGASIVLDFFGEPHLLTAGEETVVGTAILETYNEIVLCDKDQFRQATAAELVPVSFEDLGERFFTLEYTVTGKCRGCSSNTTLLDHVHRRGRELDSCPCRGPTDYSFRALLKQRLDHSTKGRHITNIGGLDMPAELEEAPSCPAFSDFTTSSVVVGFLGCPIMSQQADLDILAGRFVETYNRINGLNSKFCDRFFREIVSATATAVLLDDYAVENLFSSRGVPGRQMEDVKFPFDGRSLQEEGIFECYFEVRFDIAGRCRGCDVATITLFDEEDAVNFFEGFDDDYYFLNATNRIDAEGGRFLRRVGDYDDGEVGDDWGDDLHGDNEGGDGDNEVQGDDNGEGSDDIDREGVDDGGEWDRLGFRRKVAIESRIGPTHRRRLQQSACRCPIDAKYRAVTEKEMVDALNTTLKFANDNLTAVSVQDVVEIEDVSCDPTVNNFETVIYLEINSDSEDGVITENLTNSLADHCKRSYNSLAGRFCDPIFRYIDNVELLNQTAAPISQMATPAHRALQTTGTPPIVSNFTFVFGFRFFWVGSCRGCKKGAKLFGVSILG